MNEELHQFVDLALTCPTGVMACLAIGLAIGLAIAWVVWGTALLLTVFFFRSEAAQLKSSLRDIKQDKAALREENASLSRRLAQAERRLAEANSAPLQL